MSSLGQLLQRLSRPSTLGSHCDKLDWEARVNNITKKASNTLNFLKRNLKYCPKQCKEVNGGVWFCRLGSTHFQKEKQSRKSLPGWSVMTMVATAVSPLCSPDLAGLLLNSDVRISDWPWCTKWCMDWWQYPQLILLQQISAPEPTTEYKFRTISCNSTPYKYSFFPRTISSWNLLPAQTAEAT